MSAAYKIDILLAQKMEIMAYSLSPHPCAKIIKDLWDEADHHWTVWDVDYLDDYVQRVLGINYDDEVVTIHLLARIEREVFSGEISKFPLWRDRMDVNQIEGKNKTPHPSYV